jgi:hypothetical protein
METLNNGPIQVNNNGPRAILIKRIKSLLWRGSMMALAVLVSFLLDNVSSLDLPQWATVVLGLGLGELSKYLNTRK